MFVAGPPPDAAVIMIGANDITALNGMGASARRLGGGQATAASGAVVVVGTCPDFGVITAIPQPLRYAARTRGLQLARAQAGAVRSAGGVRSRSRLFAPNFFKRRTYCSHTTCSTVGGRIRACGRAAVARAV